MYYVIKCKLVICWYCYNYNVYELKLNLVSKTRENGKYRKIEK